LVFYGGWPALTWRASFKVNKAAKYIHVLVHTGIFEDGQLYDGLGQPCDDVELSESRWAKLQSQIRSGAYPSAFTQATSLLREFPQDRELRVLQIEAWSLLNWLPAIDYLTSRGVEDFSVNLMLARQAIVQGDAQNAVLHSELLTAKRPDSPTFRALHQISKAMETEEEMQYVQVEREIEASGDAEAIYYLAMLDLARGNSEVAESRLAYAANAAKDVPTFLGRYLFVLFCQGRYEDVLSASESINPLAESYAINRIAVSARSVLDGSTGNIEELWEQWEKTPSDRIAAHRLMKVLRWYRSYWQICRVFGKHYKAIDLAQKQVARSGQEFI
jgi:tetratricopeptide (TPR) repeat protein